MVTRFTMQAQDNSGVDFRSACGCVGDPISPDRSRLLLQDGDQEYEAAIDERTLENHLSSLRNAVPLDRLTCLTGQHLGRPGIRSLRTLVAPPPPRRSIRWAGSRALRRGSIADRAAFLSILWGRHKTYTEISRYCSTRRSVFPSPPTSSARWIALSVVDGILDVSTLSGLLTADAATLQVHTASGTTIALPRPVVTALAMELRIVCRDEPPSVLRFHRPPRFPRLSYRRKEHLERAFRGTGPMRPPLLRGQGRLPVPELHRRPSAHQPHPVRAGLEPRGRDPAKAIESWIDITPRSGHARAARRRADPGASSP